MSKTTRDELDFKHIPPNPLILPIMQRLNITDEGMLMISGFQYEEIVTTFHCIWLNFSPKENHRSVVGSSLKDSLARPPTSLQVSDAALRTKLPLCASKFNN